MRYNYVVNGGENIGFMGKKEQNEGGYLWINTIPNSVLIGAGSRIVYNYKNDLQKLGFDVEVLASQDAQTILSVLKEILLKDYKKERTKKTELCLSLADSLTLLAGFSMGELHLKGFSATGVDENRAKVIISPQVVHTIDESGERIIYQQGSDAKLEKEIDEVRAEYNKIYGFTAGGTAGV